MDRINELVSVLTKANSAYRAGSPIMSDVEFEALEQELKQLDPTNSWFLRGVNDETPKTRKVKLPVPMMSLNKVKTVEELIEWAKGFQGEFVITPKYDGLSIGLFRNKAGALQAVTRGNGEIGQDCTRHFLEIQDAPKADDIYEGENVRGEVIFTHADFEKFKQDHPEAKSSRNSATGLINGDFDATKVGDYRKLSVIAYNLSRVPELSKKEQIDILSQHYTNVDAIPHIVVTLDFFTSSTCRQDLAHLFNCWRAIYPMDGLVIDVNNAHERSMAGVYFNGNPKYSIAYKDPEFTSKANVVVGEILVQLNREGVATPVVCLKDPVYLADAEISRVSGINMQYIEDWGIAPGQEITIIRSGEVIPKIIAVGSVKIPFVEEFTSTRNYKAAYTAALVERHLRSSVSFTIEKCPYCGSTLKWNENHIHKVCPNEYCIERRAQSVIQFCSILGIKGFGEGNLRQLFDAGLVTTPYELFGLQASQLEKLPNWGETSVQNLLQEIRRVSTGNLPFAQIAHASGYFGGLGQKTIQLIVDAVGVDSDGIVNNKSVEELCQVDGVQEVTARQFRNGLWLFYDSILSELLTPAYVVSPSVGVEVLSGSVYCFTGFRDKALKEKLESLGAKVVDSFSKKVTKLVTKDADSSSSKVKKAQSFGIDVVTLEEVLQEVSTLG